MKRFAAIALSALVFALCAGCGGAAEPALGETTPQPTEPAATETVLDTASLLAAAEDAFYESFTFDVEATYSVVQSAETVAELEAYFPILKNLDDAYSAAVRRAGKAALAAIADDLPGVSLSLEFKAPDWRLLTALLALSKAPSYLPKLVSADMDLSGGTLTATLSFPAFRELISWDGDAARYTATTIFAYLNTVYDGEGEHGEYSDPELPGEYIDTIVEPLPGKYIKDGWYLPRSHATRLHTGTDIKASTGTGIRSCTDGAVEFVGYNDIAGNYVAILDDYGYEYHYCHMVELTDFLSPGDRVSRGDIIGHVGDTGNSDAPHLHLAIITPEFEYIDPYPVLARVRLERPDN